MTSDLVRYEIRSPAAVLMMNRPQKRNALSRDLIAALRAAFERSRADKSARVVILTGEGSAFCAGMDLEELRNSVDANAEVIWDDALQLASLYDLIYTHPKPTIAAVNGPAVAGGAGLVTVCDLAVSVPGAVYGYPEVRRGLVAAMVMPHLLRHVGERAARWLLLTGELIDAGEAHRLGLINACVTGTSALMETALEWARSLSAGAPNALVATKDLLRRFSRQALAVEEAAKASAAPRLGNESRQGLEAFFSKRPAPWASEG